MATARQKYISRVLARKYGLVGRVAGRYVEAGYSVELFHPTRLGPLHILAHKGNGIIAIEVFNKGLVTLDAVKSLHEKSKLVKARPVVLLYGNSVGLSSEAESYCRENGVKIRRLRAE